ncbi:glycosyl hydrolase [Oceaniferula spumae]
MNQQPSFSRRSFLKSASLAATATVLPWGEAAAETGGKSKKKGYCGGNGTGHKQIKPAWFYTWSRSGKGGIDGIEFVPMVKGRINLGQKTFDAIRAQKNITHLLGYNEPERKKQGNLSVEEGLKHWPKLEKLARDKNLRLGSPAVSNDQGGNQWLDEFMKGVKRNKLKVDFLALHWYSGTDIRQFDNWLDDMYKKYRLPLWLTEFNGWSGTHEEMAEFAIKAFKILEKHRRVERYAYFNKPKGKPGSIWKADGSLSEIGLALAAL